MIDPFIQPLLSHPQIEILREGLIQGHSLAIEGIWNGPKALLIALAQAITKKRILIITGGGLEEQRLYHDVALFTKVERFEIPSWETLPHENVPPSTDIVGERYQSLHQLNFHNPAICFCNMQSALQKILSSEFLESLTLNLSEKTSLTFKELIMRLEHMGYHRVPLAADKGEYAVRGGIIDFFPINLPDPYRIEYWGDDIDSIRIYDAVSQKSLRKIENVLILPAQEFEFIQKSNSLVSLLKYLGKETLVIFDDIEALEEHYANLKGLFSHPHPSFCSIEEFFVELQSFQLLYLSKQSLEELSEVKASPSLKKAYSEFSPLQFLSFEMFGRPLKAYRWLMPWKTAEEILYPNRFDEVSSQELLLAAAHYAMSEHPICLLCDSDREKEQLTAELIRSGLDPSCLMFTCKQGYLSQGMGLIDPPYLLLTGAELTHRHKLHRPKLRSNHHAAAIETFDLIPGEFVVHSNHGIGKFLGIETRPSSQNTLEEYIAVEYSDNGKLYVPVGHAHYISKYIGASEEKPKLHTLGSNRWKTLKAKTELAIQGYARELLNLYAQRSLKGMAPCAVDSEDVKLFEMEFPFVETEDQKRAIDAIKSDLVSDKTMDRLLCGDVGYGKTEVAMRAAFKAVIDGGYQVAVLVPTTMLAMQHYETFTDRMAHFPIQIEVVSRFRTSKEIRKALEGVKKGTVDILIGTHRLLSQDVVFNNLGLILIDEEQRFGVKAKEHLKLLKAGAACLTLSATPIPRTLYMSLVGARDLSVINTPPQDRVPIKTIVAEPTDELIRTALLRELARDGQVFVIHNRVETIFEYASYIQKLLPNARIAVAHGQMDTETIDKAFHSFKNGSSEILVATTLVENGIDIPNANTILIDRADRFGMAELYQMRGRVGRWNRPAYAYLLVPKIKSLPEPARVRLKSLAEASGRGGGMKIAMADLQFRGAGNLLGAEQSGHVAEIGFHLYCKLLKRAIKRMQGSLPVVSIETKVELPHEAKIPQDYIEVVDLRLEFYQRLGEAITLEEVEAIWDEIRDRFGPLPLAARWLRCHTRLKAFASFYGFNSLKMEKIALSAERTVKVKTQDVVEKKINMMPKITDPQIFEDRVITFLKKEFKL